MPSIMVVAHTANGDEGAVVLTERLTTLQLENAHCAAQLLERLKWAIEDAEHAEREAPIPKPVDGPSAGPAPVEADHSTDPRALARGTASSARDRHPTGERTRAAGDRRTRRVG